MSVISNTTVISNFASIGQLDLLRLLYTEIYISTQVYDEICSGIEEGYQFYSPIEQIIFPFVESGWIRLTTMTGEQELMLFGRLPPRLHQGESSCLAIAKHRNWILLTDDKAARREAKKWGLRISGTVGCLILAVERGICSLEQANAWLNEMIQKGYRSPVVDLTPHIHT